MKKIVIRNGHVIDPACGRDGIGDVFICDGKISDPDPLNENGAEILDASGKLVCPGFVDIHMHEDPVDADGRIEYKEKTSIFGCMLRMGVTTAIGGNCGESKYHPADYLDIADEFGAPVNIGMLAAHEYFRVRSGCTDKYAPATPAQKAWTAAEMTKCVERGCLGVSYGIRYAPGTDAAEIRETAAGCAALGGLAAAHIRDDAKAVFSALEEYLGAVLPLKMPVQISHIGSMAGFGQMKEFLALLEKYREQNPDIACDCYPYDAFCTGIGSACYDEGWLNRYDCGYDVLEIAEGEFRGQRCTEELFRKIRKDFPDYKTICHVMDADDVKLAFSDPYVMLGSDGTLSSGQGHPRAAGAFPRFLSQYVREGVVSRYEAVRKMTLLPAERLGLKSKGRLTPGADADVVILDPEKLRDTATFEDPIAVPEGIDRVILGGETVCLEGKILQPRAGRSVRLGR